MPRPVVLVAALVLAAGVGCGEDPDAGPGPPTVTATSGDAPSTTDTGSDAGTDTGSDAGTGRPRVVRTVATGLAVPWGLEFLPDGRAVVTERDSRRVLLVDPDGGVEPVGELAQATPTGEGGLLGVAVSPDFTSDRTLFFYLSTAEDNRIVRAELSDTDELGRPEVVLDGIPVGAIHDGGRLAFGPDGQLYASTGETGDGELAQDRSSLAGKILRITPDGEPAPGNPDPGSPVWSYGHRNVQGLAFDDDGRLWASEFGESTYDELNLVEKGGNHGWPEAEGRSDEPTFVNPQVVWGTGEASPSGLAYLDGHLWMAALNGERLWRVEVQEGRASDPTGFFVGEYGRLRSVEVAPDGRLWVTTSNRDGRGDPAGQDDRILVVDPG